MLILLGLVFLSVEPLFLKTTLSELVGGELCLLLNLVDLFKPMVRFSMQLIKGITLNAFFSQTFWNWCLPQTPSFFFMSRSSSHCVCAIFEGMLVRYST